VLLCSTEPGVKQPANLGRGKKAKNKRKQRSRLTEVAHAEASEVKSDQGDYHLPSGDMRYTAYVAFCLCSGCSAHMLAVTLLLYKSQQSSKLLLQEDRCCCAKLSDPLGFFCVAACMQGTMSKINCCVCSVDQHENQPGNLGVSSGAQDAAGHAVGVGQHGYGQHGIADQQFASGLPGASPSIQSW